MAPTLSRVGRVTIQTLRRLNRPGFCREASHLGSYLNEFVLRFTATPHAAGDRSSAES